MQTARQTQKVNNYQDFNRCQQSAENSIKYHFGNLLLIYFFIWGFTLLSTQKYKSKKQKNVLPWQNSSNVCRGLKCKEPQERFLSPRNIKLISFNLCRGMEKQITHKNICKSKKQKKKCCHRNTCCQVLPKKTEKKVLPWQHLLPDIVEKLISSNPCRGLECKELRERLLSPRKMKKCCHGNTRCQVLLKN